MRIEDDILTVHAGGETRVYPAQTPISIGDQTFQIPLESLRYWLRGELDASGTPLLAPLQAESWRVEILKSDPSGPRLVQLQHPDVSMRLKIKRWQLAEA